MYMIDITIEEGKKKQLNIVKKCRFTKVWSKYEVQKYVKKEKDKKRKYQREKYYDPRTMST